MQVTDVWVNWFQAVENSYQIAPFYEWRKTDTIELLEQVPVVYLSSEDYRQIEQQLNPLPVELLRHTFRKASARKQQQRFYFENCFIVTDGRETLAVDTLGYSLPMRKSRLIPRQAQEVVELVTTERRRSYSFERKQPTYHCLNLPPEAMLGLTRREREDKQQLFVQLDELIQTDRVDLMRYLVTEWQQCRYEEICDYEFEQLWGILYEQWMEGWSERHEFMLHIVENLPIEIGVEEQ